MATEDYEPLVQRLRLSIGECAAVLADVNVTGASLSEADTERLIIQPLLLALGYAHLDFFQRSRARGSKTFPDYTLLSGTPHRWVLEAKALDQRLGPKETLQVLGYASALSCKHAVLTNGRRWKVYHFPSPDVVLDIEDVFADDRGALQLIALAKQNLTSIGTDDPVAAGPVHREHRWSPPVPAKTSVAQRARQTPTGATPLEPAPDVAPVFYPLARIAEDPALTKGRKPVEVRLGDGEQVRVSTWADVARAGVEFVCAQYGLPPLPFALPGHSRFYLLSRGPVCADGIRMERPLPVMIGGEPAYWDNERYARADTVAKCLLAVMRLIGAPLDAVTVAVL